MARHRAGVVQERWLAMRSCCVLWKNSEMLV